MSNHVPPSKLILLATAAYKKQRPECASHEITSILQQAKICYPLPGYVVFKVSSDLQPAALPPTPYSEIFVFSDDVEGVHIRFAKIARGGIRISRRVDYRAEALDLALAQTLKNSCILPAGAKGAFIVKTNIDLQDAYRSYITCLLSVVDDDDPYLFVAPDVGTSGYSDIANAVSHAHQYWLNDAFATGGTNGFNHKEFSITSRSVWFFVEDALQQLHQDIQHSEITVVGIGSMSGDVFGNGMLRSNNIRLVAAFSSTHIFIDPQPNMLTSYQERLRLFLSAGSWDQYDASLLSPGGMIVARNVERVILSVEARHVLGTDVSVSSPEELITIILQAPCDLLYNGGVGTYIYASTEQIPTPGVRVDHLRCSIIGEGGNLGCTSLARMEFADRGGKIRGDFVDNAGGVICSDYEVQLKILLKHHPHLISLIGSAADPLRIRATVHDHVLANLTLTRRSIECELKLAQDPNYHKIFARLLALLGQDSRISYFIRDISHYNEPNLYTVLAVFRIFLNKLVLQFQPFVFLNSYFPAVLLEQVDIQIYPLLQELSSIQLTNYITARYGITFFQRMLGTHDNEPVEQMNLLRKMIEEIKDIGIT